MPRPSAKQTLPSDGTQSETTLKLPEDLRLVVDQVISEVDARHEKADPETLSEYVARAADGRKGTVNVCRSTIRLLEGAEFLPHKEALVDYIASSLVEVGNHVAELAKERLGKDVVLPPRSEVMFRVEEALKWDHCYEQTELAKLPAKLKSLHQKHELAIVFMDVSQLGADYENLIRPELEEDFFGDFWAATCPIGESACFHLLGLTEAAETISAHSVTLIHGIENWHDDLADVTRLIRHWNAYLRRGEGNTLVVLPYFDLQTKTVLEIREEIRKLGIDLIDLPIAFEQPAIEPIDWDAKHGDYPKEVETYSDALVDLVYEHVKETLGSELSSTQAVGLEDADDELREKARAEMAAKLRKHINLQRDLVRNELMASFLRNSTPHYSVKFHPDSLGFYQTHLEPWFKRFSIPFSALRYISPNLSRTMHEKGVFPKKTKARN